MGGFVIVIVLCFFILMLVFGEFGQSFFEVCVLSYILIVRIWMLFGLSVFIFWVLEFYYIGFGDLN